MSYRVLLIPAVIVFTACQAQEPAGPDTTPSFASAGPVVAHVTGEGVVNVGVPMSFTMNALLHADGSATGEAHHFAPIGGNVIEFRTQVTCVSFDAANRRAWIGGVITENNSTDPPRMQERNQVGRDIWWRMVDYGNGGSGTPDRQTFLGFTGDAGFLTSAAYCAGQPWPGPGDTPPQPVDARTSPVIDGNISIKP